MHLRDKWNSLSVATKKTIYVMCAVSVLLIIIIPIVFSFNYQKAGNRMAGSGTGSDNQTDTLTIDAKITKINTEDFSYSLLMKIKPTGIAAARSKNIQTLAKSLYIFVKSQPFHFPAGHTVSEIVFQTNFETGTTFLYPFDYYEDELEISSLLENSSLPTKVNYVGTFKELDVDCSIESKPTKSAILRIKITRSGTTKFFSVSIIFLMWLLSFTILTLSVTVWMRKRVVEPPVIILI